MICGLSVRRPGEVQQLCVNVPNIRINSVIGQGGGTNVKGGIGLSGLAGEGC